MSLTVTFTDTSTPVGLIAAWVWDFGDGSPLVTTQNPVHTYAVSGTYQVTLYIEGVYGALSQVTHPVTVNAAGAHLFNFALSNGGWSSLGFGTYDPGFGWRMQAGNLHIGIGFVPAGVLIIKMTAVYVITLGTVSTDTLQQARAGGSGGGSISPTAHDISLRGVGTYSFVMGNGVIGFPLADWLEITVGRSGTSFYCSSVTVEFTGVDPF